MIKRVIAFFCAVLSMSGIPTTGMTTDFNKMMYVITNTTSSTNQKNCDEKNDKTLIGVYSISGVVKDEANRPLANAYVILSKDGENIGEGTYTDENGTYILTEVASGKYDLIVVTIPIPKSSYSKLEGCTEMKKVVIKNKNVVREDIIVKE